MKKTLQAVSSGFLSVILLAGCSGTPVAPDSSTDNSKSAANTLDWNRTDDSSLKGQEITLLWHMTDGSQTKILEEFTKETGIKVKEMGVDYASVYNKVTTAAMSNSTDIDVVEMDTIWAGQFLKGNIAVDLTDVIPQEQKDAFLPAVLSSVSYDGHIMAFPWAMGSKHFYWNNTLLKKAGIGQPPKTWEEFKEDSVKLKKAGITASGWSWKQSESLTVDYIGLLYAFGGQFFDEAGKPALNKGGGLEALKYMVDLLQTDKTVDPASLQWNEDDVKHAFENGSIAMMSNWENMYPELNDPTKSKVADQTDVGLLPGHGDVISSVVSGSEGLGIMKGSQHKEAALAFLKWMASKEYQLPAFEQIGQYPVLKDLYQDPAMKAADSTGTLDKIYSQFQYGVDRPSAPGYVVWSDALVAELHAALAGEKSPEQALNDAAANIEKIMKDSQS